jgi:ATP-dependent DNA helicase RecQ
MSRKKVDETAAFLVKEGFRALPYHAGMDSKLRERTQNSFINEEGVIIVATIAFGMGIDKPNVRFVAHLDLPKSLEAYYQETGRAGRDSLPATAWMVYNLADIVAIRRMIESSDADDQHKRLERRKLDALVGFCETSTCRRQTLLRYFGDPAPDSCGNCDMCLNPVDQWDGTVAAQQLLSAVYRTGQRFGAAYVVKVLRGESDERISRFGHDRLSVFGIGKDLSEPEWFSVVRQVVALGLLAVDMEGFGGLHCTAESGPVFKGSRTVFLRRDPVTAIASKRRKKSIATEAPTGTSDEGLFKLLRAKRMALAKSQKVPPYVIFHDSTLHDIATRKPSTLALFRQIPGVGEVKLERYGAVFLEIVQQYLMAGASDAREAESELR